MNYAGVQGMCCLRHGHIFIFSPYFSFSYIYCLFTLFEVSLNTGLELFSIYEFFVSIVSLLQTITAVCRPKSLKGKVAKL